MHLTKSIPATRFLPCLGTSSCPAAAGGRLDRRRPSFCVGLSLQLDLVIHLSPAGRQINSLASHLHLTHFPHSTFAQPSSASLSSFVTFPNSPAESKAFALWSPKYQQPLLFIPSIHLPPTTGQLSACLCASPFPPSQPSLSKAGTPLTRHTSG